MNDVDLIRGKHFLLFGPNYQRRDIRLFEQNSHQLAFVAHHIHLCFQARVYDESQLAPNPRPQGIKLSERMSMPTMCRSRH